MVPTAMDVRKGPTKCSGIADSKAAESASGEVEYENDRTSF